MLHSTKVGGSGGHPACAQLKSVNYPHEASDTGMELFRKRRSTSRSAAARSTSWVRTAALLVAAAIFSALPVPTLGQGKLAQCVRRHHCTCCPAL